MPDRLSIPDLQTVLGVILGGGAGSRLYPLTKKRAKPAVPLGANYRLIDIPVSNCINSGINKIYCLTQFNSASLNRHLAQAYVSMSMACPAHYFGTVWIRGWSCGWSLCLDSNLNVPPDTSAGVNVIVQILPARRT